MVGIMAYRKSIKGDSNQANEVNSHNRIQINTGAGFTVFAIYLVVVATGVIIFMAVVFGDLLKYAVVGTVCTGIVFGWYWLVHHTIRVTSHTKTTLAIDRYRRDQAWLESRVAVREALYALYLDENDNLKFMDTKQITENRHYPAQIEAPKEAADDKTILEFYDRGLSARSIEKAFEKKVAYRKITDVLSAYRPDWNKKGKSLSDIVVDADEED